VKGLFATGRGDRRISGAAENSGDSLDEVRIVIDDQDARPAVGLGRNRKAVNDVHLG
jgi:hypothetical protein